MSLNSGSSRISATRPNSVTCRYHAAPSITVTDTRGSRRMCFSRIRVESMLTSMRSPSQSYQVTAVCGEPSCRSVAMTAGLALRRSRSTSGGSGSFGIPLSLLARVALEPQVRLEERCRAEILVGAFALARFEVGGRRCDELVLAHPFLDALRPERQAGAQAPDVLGDGFHSRPDAEGGGREPLGLAAEDLVEGLVPGLDVDLRRRRGRNDVPGGEDAHTCRVTGEHSAVIHQVADVVGRVAGGCEGLDARRRVPDHLDARLRHGQRLVVQRFEVVAVEAPGGRDQTGRVDDMRRADLRDVDADVRVLPEEVPRGAGVVEVDVRQEQVPDRAEVHGIA